MCINWSMNYLIVCIEGPSGGPWLEVGAWQRIPPTLLHHAALSVCGQWITAGLHVAYCTW